MIEANELRAIRAKVALEVEKAFYELSDEERYKDCLFRNEETTVSDIVELVRKGQPVNGLQKSFPDDDDEMIDGDSDEKEFQKHDSIISRYTYWDDMLLMASEMNRRVRAESAINLAGNTSTPVESSSAESSPAEPASVESSPVESTPAESTPAE